MKIINVINFDIIKQRYFIPFRLFNLKLNYLRFPARHSAH